MKPVRKTLVPLASLPRLILISALAGCAAGGSAPDPRSKVYLNEAFASTETYSRVYPASVTETCEAARRALLSQGYVITTPVKPDAVNGRKSFQPQPEMHVQIEFHVVCVNEGRSAGAAPAAASSASGPAPGGAEVTSTVAFVNAVQDRYSLKKSLNSASLGVGVLGSVSLPVSSTDESLVKVASETIPAGAFYDRFFSLIDRYLEVP